VYAVLCGSDDMSKGCHDGALVSTLYKAVHNAVSLLSLICFLLCVFCSVSNWKCTVC